MEINRKSESTQIQKLLKIFPVVAILGPRQIGKTFLAEHFKHQHAFDLENPRDRETLDQPQTALENLKGLTMIDEIQRAPNLFPVLRYLVDHQSRNRYLILGSASRDLIQQSSETLAGRIGYFYLNGFGLEHVGVKNIRRLWFRGGFPRAYLARSNEAAMIWLDNYITTFLERDIPQLGITIPARTLFKFWKMISHYHGQILNYSELGQAFGVSDVTVRNYASILEGTFMVRLLQPWHVNLGKRLVKRPKIYIRDSGLFHRLLSVEIEKDLRQHPKIGFSWEGFALEICARVLGKRSEELYFWGTHSGAEVDLFWQNHGKNWAVEFKYQDAPKLTKSMVQAVKDLKLSKLWVIYPGDRTYALHERIFALPLSQASEICG